MASNPQELTAAAEFLHSYGGWGLSVILMAAIAVLHKNKLELRRQMTDLLEKRTTELMSIVRESTAVIAQHHTERELIETMVRRVEDMMGRLLDEVRRR